MTTVLTGLEIACSQPERLRAWGRCGLLAHPASVDRHLRHAVDLLAGAGCELAALFGPQHGFGGQTQDNMIEWQGFVHPRLAIPVHSLYGEVRQPTPEMLAGLDTLIVDLQDVGARYYTFAHTLVLCLEACGRAGCRLAVLDRPNPIGGTAVEGPVLDPAFRSFVGLLPVPVRHGLTLGEIAGLATGEFGVDCPRLEVVAMKGWSRTVDFDSTGLPWVLPSPNMPTLETAYVYTGMCLLEGTTLSEGRGTTRPFEIAGAPWLDGALLARLLSTDELPGVRFRPLVFEPTFQKHAGMPCGGVQLHVTDRREFRPFRTTLAFLRAALGLAPRERLWRDPPYEYEAEKLPFDILAGTDRLRLMLESGRGLDELEAGWADDLAAFEEKAAKHRLY